MVRSTLIFFHILLFPALLRADSSSMQNPQPANAEQAERLSRNGHALAKQQRYESALSYFLRSRALLPSYKNTKNAAICLYRLDRWDESLEMYETLLRDYSAEVNESERGSIEALMRKIRSRVGTLDISTNGQKLFVDGRMRGRFPRADPIRVNAGRRRIRIERDGYRPFTQWVNVPAGGTIARDAWLERLPSPPSRDGWFLGSFGGYGRGFLLGSDAVLKAPHGFLLGARGGYLFDFKLALELTFGFLALSSVSNRTATEPGSPTEDTDTFYHLQDHVRFQGGVGGVGASYRLPIAPAVDLLGRATVGLISAQSANSIDASAKVGDNMVPAFVDGRSQVLVSQPGFVMPEVGVEVKWMRVRIGVVLGALFVVPDGPTFGPWQIGVNPDGCNAETREAVECTPNSDIVARERAYGPFQVWVPQITVGYVF